MSDIDEVKRRLNIVDVIGEYVKLQKAGGNYRGRCPFHSEKTPSFFVSPEKEIWHCFGGCQKGGDVFRFIMEIEGVEFGQALRTLAARAGVTLSRGNKRSYDQKSKILEINELATRFFARALDKSEGGKKTLEYLASRKVSQDSIELFHLGYAPSSWRALLEFLAKQGYSKEEAVLAGLAVKNEQGSVYDRFRARLMFPIYSPAGSVAGFTGRVLTPDAKEAKYVNTPQTLAYDKSRELYGLYQGKQDIKKSDEAIFVEGNLDVVLSNQAGVGNVVASSGTALTTSHLQTIGRYTKNVTFCFDSDQAGQSAATRAFELALQAGFEVKALVLDQEKDAADMVTNQGSQAWQEASKRKLPVMEFAWQKALRNHDVNTIEGKKTIAQELFNLLAYVTNNIEKGYWLAQFASRLGVREEDMLKEFKKVGLVDKNAGQAYNNTVQGTPSLRQDRISYDRENLVAITLLYPQLTQLTSGVFDIVQLRGEIAHSDQELLLKAEIFWPSEFLAKRELERIVRSFTFARQKEETINKSSS